MLDVKLDISSSEGDEGELSAQLQGPFQSNGDDRLPSVDFDVSASIDSAGSSGFDFDGGLTLTTDGAWVNFQGTDFQLDDATFQALEAAYEQSAAQHDDRPDGSLEQFGVDPRDWVTGLTNEGTEDRDGTEVVHVSGDVDLPKLVADLDDVARQTGAATSLTPADLHALARSVTGATVDVYAATSDDSLREIDLGLTLADPRGGSGELDADLSIAISDAGVGQDIAAPENARPLDDLLSQIPGAAQALGFAGAPAAGGQPPTASKAAKAYYDCVAKAKSSRAVEDCAGLLGG